MVAIDWSSWKTRFTILVFISMILTMVALFTGGWGVYTFSASAYGYSESQSVSFGILTDRDVYDGSYVYEIPRYSFEKWCVAAMFLTIFSQIAIVGLVLLSYTDIKLNISRLPLILACLAAVAMLLLLTVVAVYPAKAYSTYDPDSSSNYYGNQDDRNIDSKKLLHPKDLINKLLDADGASLTFSMGYSYYITVATFIIMIAATICGYKMQKDES